MEGYAVHRLAGELLEDRALVLRRLSQGFTPPIVAGGVEIENDPVVKLDQAPEGGPARRRCDAVHVGRNQHVIGRADPGALFYLAERDRALQAKVYVVAQEHHRPAVREPAERDVTIAECLQVLQQVGIIAEAKAGQPGGMQISCLAACRPNGSKVLNIPDVHARSASAGRALQAPFCVLLRPSRWHSRGR